MRGLLRYCLLLWFMGCLPANAQRPTPNAQRPSSWDVEAREYLGTPASEAAVRRGLEFLRTRQEADGHWRSGGYDGEVGITALCLLAYLAAGHQPGRGRYGLVMNEATDYLLKCVRMDGMYAPPGLVRSWEGGAGPMYGHGFATLALAEVYGMTRRRDLKPKLQAAVRLIENCQTRTGIPGSDGGWRYQPEPGDADISVTIVQIMALRGARNAGLKVSQEVIDRAMAYVKRCANRDGGFSYQVGQFISGPARTGAGVLALILAGERNSPECQNGLRYLIAHPLDGMNEEQYRRHFYYSLYYVTQAMYQVGGDYWKQWYPVVRDRLTRMQETDGSWANGRNAFAEAGPVYATAMSLLILQVPAGLLPIYQK